MTVENYSNESCLKENDIEKDRRRIDLLNDPNYGIVLCFLDKFRSVLDLPNYPLQLFEDHLVNFQEQNPPRLIDFHFTLLKRLSLAKNAQRNKFDSIITKFASRFDINDSEHLQTIGYLQSDIHIKIRLLKNLLESQFDLNQTFRNTLIDKSSREIKSLPLGRDRFGVSYWFFMDNNCCVRLFREDVDIDRTWTIVAKNRDELEKFIKLLINDFVVRKKFSDWIIDYEPFSSLPPSNEFEQCYLPISMNVEEKEIEIAPTNDENSEVPIKRKRGRPQSSAKLLQKEIEIISNDNEKLVVPTKRKPERLRRSTKLFNNKIDVPIKQEEKEIESMSNDDEKPDLHIKRKRGRPRGSGKLSIKKEEEQTITRSGRKRNSTTNENNNDEKLKIDDDQSQQDETSMDDISLAIRRSSRFRKASTMEPSSKTMPQLSDTKTKRSINNKTKASTNLSRRRRRKTTSSSDENIDYLSEDEYYSDDYLSNQSQLDIDDHFFELDDADNNTNNEQLRTAKTAQTSTIITTCYVCLKSDRPEVLLLCDACDDAYHLECLCPILLSVPDGDWFCPLCEHKKLSNCLVEKLKELLINYNKVQMKQILKKSLERKIKLKEYSSDESITASESEHENDEESMLSINQINENSNLSLSSCIDENINNISQRGRHRRTRFDMKKILHNHHEFNHNYDSNDDDDDDNRQITNFNLQLPTKITRLLHRRDRSAIKSEQQIKTFPTRFCHTSIDSNDTNELNEKLGSPLVYVNSDGNSRQIKSVITNSKQTLKIVRRWNDVQRRSRIKATNMKILNETITSDYTDDNSNYCLDDTSPLPYSNDINSNNETKDENNTNIRSKINIVQPTTLISIDKYSSRNIVKKVDANFDRLTRDIQFAVNEAHLLPTTTTITKPIDQQHVKRISKRFFSPYITKTSLPSFLSKPSSDVYNNFKPKDSSISSTTYLSNSILTPSSSSSLLDANDDQTAQMTNA